MNLDGFDSLTYGLKALVSGGVPSAASVPVEERCRQILGGRLPDSSMAAELAMEAAESMAEEEELRAVRWPVEPWDPWKNYR